MNTASRFPHPPGAEASDQGLSQQQGPEVKYLLDKAGLLFVRSGAHSPDFPYVSYSRYCRIWQIRVLFATL